MVAVALVARQFVKALCSLSSRYRLVDQSVAAFRRQQTEQAAAPVIADLHRHFEQHRAEILAQPGIDAAEATRRLIARLLHQPSIALKAAAPAKDLEAALRRLFALNDKEHDR